MRSVLAAVMTGPERPIELREVPVPDLPPGGALLRTLYSEVCGTDVHLWHGRLADVPYPIIPGHVSVGVLEEARGPLTGVDGARLSEGDRVVFFDVHRTCGRCRACTVWRTPTRCAGRRVYGITDPAADGLFGGWAQAIYLEPGVAMARLPDGVSPEAYIGGGCGLLTAVHVIDRAEVRLGDTVVVQGVGAVGLSAAALARLAGAGQVIAIGAPATRLALARQMGADTVIDIDAVPPDARHRRVLELTEGDGADIVLEAAGSARAVEEGLELLRHGGRYVIAGHYTDAGESTVNAHRQITKKHVEIRGSWGSEVGHFLRAIRLLAGRASALPWSAIGARTYGLRELDAALADAEAHRVPKALVKPVVLLLACLLGLASTAGGVEAQDRRTRNLVLVTLDGARTQEIFGGLDIDVLRATAGDVDPASTDVHRRFWADTPAERRARLMPFLWRTLLTRHGSIAGNHALGSRVLLTNRHRFSYPGYSEILTGEAHDDVIDSNDRVQNPFPTVLEFLRGALDVSARDVAAFASWNVFDVIVEHEPGTITVNAGYQAFDHPDPAVRDLSRLQFEAPTPWDSVRHDVFTASFAMAYLRTYRPRVLYVAIGDHDDWAHDGRYDRYLDSLARADRLIERLWTFLQSDAAYRDATALVIAVDHGRGRTPEDWSSHGSDIEGAQDVWLVVASPDVPLRGEWQDGAPVGQNQIAATLARLLGFDWASASPDAGPPIARVFDR